MKKITTAFLLFFCCFSPAFSQSVKIDGVVEDAETKAPVPYATVQILGSFNGTAANDKGEFSLMAKKNDTIKISCLGYKTVILTIQSAMQRVGLQPEPMILNAITVYDNLPDAKSIVKRAFRNIRQNYINDPFTLKMFYRHYCRDDSIYGRLIEAAVDVYKAKGYRKPRDYENKRDKYKLKQLRRSYDLTRLNTHHVPIAFDDVLATDVVAYQDDETDPSPLFFISHSQSVLRRNYGDYTYELTGISQYEGNDVYEVTFIQKELKRPAETGIAINLHHEGKFYVQANNYAIIKCIFLSDFKGLKYNKDVIFYKQEGEKYHLSHIVHDQILKLKDKPAHHVHIELLVNEIITGKNEKFKHQPITNEVIATSAYDPQFWESYNIIKENPILEKVRVHLEKRESLVEQYLGKAKKDTSEWEEIYDHRRIVKDLLEQNKDEVIYIDFWASWCNPCISEFIKSSKVVNEYQDLGVRFVYVSIDQNKERWLKFRERYGLKDKEHYRIADDKEMMKLYSISSIPKYMLITPEGRVFKDAPPPSLPEFKEWLAPYIKKE